MMNNEEAKELLRCYRGKEDASDPYFAEALQRVREDPELERWLATELASNEAAAAGLRQIAPPAGLRGNIVADTWGNQYAAGRRRMRNWLAAAAAVVLLIGLSFLNLSPRKSGETLFPWQSASLAAIEDLQSGKRQMEVEGADSAALRTWLLKQQAPAPPSLPPGLAEAASVGCTRLTAGGWRVSIIGFHLNGDRLAHLVTVENIEMLNAPPEGRPEFIQKGEWAIASWSSHGQSYMLAMKGSEEELRQLLTPRSSA